jgi:Predicted Fe-S oxidoreductases
MQKRVAMSKQIFKAIINQAAALNIFGIVISGGEPLLHADFFNFVKFAYKRNLLIGVSTNATLIDKKTATQLSNFISNVQVSLDGSNDITHGFIRNSYAAFAETIKGIKNLKHENVYVTVSVVLSSHNITEINEIISLCISLGVDKIKFQRVKNIGNAKYSKTLKVNIDLANLFNIISQNIDKIDIIFDDPMNKNYVCTAGSSIIYFNPEGRAFPCPFLLESQYNFDIINVKEEDWIRNIWNSKEMYLFRKFKEQMSPYTKSSCIAERISTW